MGHFVYIALLGVFAISYSNGCDMGPNGGPWIPQTATIKDTFRGEMLSIEMINIAGIANIGPAQNLNEGPYFGASLQGSTFTFFTIDSSFDDYEENETFNNTSLTVLFNCVGGTTRSLTIIIFITDTNNNAPIFIPSELEFTLIPPLPPGFSITGCFEDIIVRDIDLTTQRIDFQIFDTTLFEITYDAESSTRPKEFKASLKTKTFIRTIPETIEFKISATDVDLTNDPQLTTYATVRIKSLEGGFELPDDPVFTQAYYLATYTKDHTVILEEPIALQQGYTEEVQFHLDQGTTRHFSIQKNGSEISLLVVTPLTEDFFDQRQIFLVINAEIENTSGANAAIIIELPEEEELKFEQPTYEGAIVDNILQLSQLVLSQGNPVSVKVLSDYADFFQAELDRNIIRLSMTPLSASIIEENTFLNLQVIASSNRTSVSTVVTLEIVKDDSVTPVFERAVYSGLYDSIDGLKIEQIVLVQGYDETVRVSLLGEHSTYFALDQSRPILNLILDVPSLPTDLFRERNLLLYLKATKPRTVGATTAISIALPEEIQLEFEQQYYTGVIEDNVLRLTDLILSKGYENGVVTVTILSTYAEFFLADIKENKITLSMSPLNIETVEQNTFLNLEVVAETNRSLASTIVTLEIIKNDSITPVFERAVYEGAYDPIYGLALDEIVITQGYDDSVNVSLRGDHSSYFQLVRFGPVINVTVSSLPTELFQEQNILLYIEATKPRTVGATTAISIALPEEVQLEFEKPNYEGIVKDNNLVLPDLILSQGYDTGPVTVTIYNEYASYFAAKIENNKISLTMSRLDDDVIEENNFINLHVVASTSRSSAESIVTLEIIKNDTLTPVFERTVYEGTYDPTDGLKLEEIVLVQGYDNTVAIVLEGEHASYFQVKQQGPRINVTASSLPPNLLALPSLLLSIEATKPRTVGSNAAISIALPEARDMRFAAEVYSGAIRENSLQIDKIVLSVGYTNDVLFTISGEYASYFIVRNEQNQITLGLRAPIADSVIEENNFLLLTLSASALNAVTATTSIAIDIIKEDLTTPVFSQNIYYGVYESPSSINIGVISLSQGYRNGVTFRLVGEHSQYFRPNVTENGEVLLKLHSTIPEEVIFNEKVLLFSILAEKDLTVGANAAVSMNFPRELTEPSILRFSRNIYMGSYQQNVLNLEDVILESGYATSTEFRLTGDFSQHFTLRTNNNILTISVANSLPTEIYNLKFISLEVEARRTRAVSVVTTIIIDIEQPETVVPPVFARAYYTGIYTQENGLHFENGITLSQGFDETVTFLLEGESSQWFDFRLSQDNNTVFITTRNNIPIEVVEENFNLLFSIVARKPGATEGRAAISIDLPKASEVLGFDRLSYVGSIANNTVDLGPIVLAEVPTSAVSLTLDGQLNNYFDVSLQGTTVSVTLRSPIAAESIPSNRIIVLEIQATAPQAKTAYATVVFHVILDDDTAPVPADLAFGETYYVGSYTADGGLALSSPITLAEGYDSDVVFALEGDHSQWFAVRNLDNTVILELSSPIPPNVIADNQKLIFVIRAQRPEGVAARATVVISLTEEVTSEILSFDRISYVGSIANNSVHLGPISLAEGPTSGVTVTVLGQLNNYFSAKLEGTTVTVTLRSPIPAESIPSNRIIVLEIQATAPQAKTAYATVVFHVILDDDTAPVPADLAFGETYYVGSYTADGGLALSSPITLAEGYDSDVVFALEGDHSQWFAVRNLDNTVILELSSPIPPNVIADNQKLIFVIRAQRPEGVAARATVVISLTEEVTSEILSFDRISYVGSIANNSVHLGPISLAEGPTSGVTVTVLGQLNNYFSAKLEGTTVTVTLRSPIPAESIPSNRIIVLEIQATAPQAKTAYATVVFHVILDDDTAPVPADLAFGETYYVGSYTADGGLALSSPITLAEGYDSDVVFALEGDHSQWFAVRNLDNTVILELSSPIPPNVIADNQKLIFVIRAQRPEGVAARATVVISLTEEVTSEILSFDRISYVGSIANNSVHLGPISLAEGPTSGVTVTVLGQLNNYFSAKLEGTTVTVTLRSPIPAESIPSNRIIVLEIQATAPQAKTAYATVVFHVILDDDTVPVPADLAFGETYYVGSYTADSGLVLSSPITLAEGYDSDVLFALEGDHSQWFAVRNLDNTVILELSNPIPPNVIADNQKLIFVIRAQRPEGVAARATVVISLTEEVTSEILSFDRISYVGSIANNSVHLGPINLAEGPTSGVSVTVLGQLNNYFSAKLEGTTVTVTLRSPIPAESIPSNRIIVLEIQATAPQAKTAYATVVFHVILDDDTAPVSADLAFGETYYVGSYTADGGLVLSSPITLAEGYDSGVLFALEGDHSQWFAVRNLGNSVILELSSPIPPNVIADNQKLIFVIRAQRPEGVAARATVVISLTEEVTSEILSFDRISYVGSIANNSVHLGPINLAEGPTSGVTVTVLGQLNNYFSAKLEGTTVTVTLRSPIPAESIPSNRIIVLEIQATAPQAKTAYATVVFHVILDDDTAPVSADLAFGETYYVGSYTADGGLVLSSPITLAEGYDSGVLFALEGDHSQWFAVRNLGNSVILELSSPIPPNVIADNQKLIFVIRAQRPEGVAARATVVISLTEEVTSEILSFDRISYVGSIANNSVHLSPINLAEGPTSGVTVTVLGQLNNYFSAKLEGTTVTVTLRSPIPAESIPSNRIIVLEIQATAPQAKTAYATVVFHVILDDDTAPVPTDLAFGETYYVGSYTADGGLILSSPITLAEGYDSDVLFALEGDHSQWFAVRNLDNTVILELSSPIPPNVIADNQKLIFVIRAQRPEGVAARATVVILLSEDNQDSSVTFDKVLYEGIIQGSSVLHETITVIGYIGTDDGFINIIGAYASFFRATILDGLVVVKATGPLTLQDINHVVLELRAANSGAVLILQVTATEEQPPPTVTFEGAPYVFSVENRYTGLVGRVRAAADNGEPVAYSLQVDNDHLRSRLSVDNTGALRLSAPGDRGVYDFQVIASTAFTQESAQTTVQLIVVEVPEGPTVCGDDNIVTSPLIIIDRDEEEEHRNLINLNNSELPGCHYTLTNRWPADQNWLYVDESGLHTTAIDREHPSISHMALSQIQVELNLVCDSDVTRTKRSLDRRLDWLGPYDYGTKTWVLTDSISFNPRRSIVNLIVNDINDNNPIFVGKDNEPIIVGYPSTDLEETVMPRSLAELQATDADVGENAALLFWSSEPEIAVSPTTGFVHVRAGAQLQENMMLTVHATDRNGEGLTGSISLMVKLLDSENIAVITVRDAFLEDESRILGNISNAIGYEVRALRSVIVSLSEEQTTRKKRNAPEPSGTSLEIYVYGLIQREPVAVETLSNDINSAAIVTIDIATILSLEDHLEGNEICVMPGRDAGLLVATIILSILLFILIIAAIVWLYLTRKKRENYDQFSDANSLASQNESAVQPPKPDFVTKPRLDIEELKRSERRLQDMLNAPIDEVSVEPMPSPSNKDAVNSVAKIPIPDLMAPIVIQDKLKDATADSDDGDEFGEVKKLPRRKSVVTFNENVEKIIHVEEEPEVSADPDYEVYKF